MVNFNFSGKGLGLASPPHFVYDFSFMIYILLTDQIILLLLLLKILENMCITIVY